MDGIVSAMLLGRSLVKGFNVKPVIVCPEDNKKAVENLAYIVGLHFHDSIDGLLEYPLSLAAIAFTKDVQEAPKQADQIISKGLPSAVISIECPGANSKGVYHNAIGLDVTELEAKQDVLFNKLKEKGILNIAIGDLGNEIGMGTIKEHLQEYVPYAAKGSCKCSCEGGIVAETKADNIITATVSDWGCYGLIAALSYLKCDLNIMHTKEMEKDVMIAASRSGMIICKEAKTIVQYQIGALKAFCTVHGINMNHVKPHGELYNMAGKDINLAVAICEGIKEVDSNLILLALSGSKMIEAAKNIGLKFANEVFADRAYKEDGSLV